MSAAPTLEPVLAVAHLAKAFSGFRAVDDVSFSVSAGEIVALIGPNGAGKTTTFNMISGQLAPDAGSVRLDGRDVTGASPRDLWRLRVARTFQITATFASMTVAENVAVALISVDGDLARLSPLDAGLRERALNHIGEVGMREAADRLCGTLAYGDVKRVELAMALVNDPRLLLMDEPTAGMAPKERAALMGLVAKIARERRSAILFTEHDMDTVFANADRILVMNRGKLIASGTPAEVRADPHVRDVYLGHAPAPAAVAAREHGT